MTQPTAHFEVRPVAGEVPAARARVRASLDGLDAAAIDRILLLASEVITGAVLHAGARVTIDVIREPAAVRIEVDGGPAGASGRQLLSSMGGGMALDIINHEASRWGVRPGNNEVLWFEVDLP